MNPPIPREFNFGGNDTFPQLTDCCIVEGYSDRKFERSWYYGGASVSLINIAKSIVIHNQVFNLPVYSGENSTFNLQFRGPQLRCTSPPDYNNTYPLEYHSGHALEVEDEISISSGSLRTPVFVSKWDHIRDSLDAPLYSITKHVPLNVTARRTPTNVTSFQVSRLTSEMTCKPESVLYNIKVSFPRGIQTIQHTTSDRRMLSPITEYSNNSALFPRALVGAVHSILMATLHLPASAQSLQDFNHRMRVLFPIVTEWALLDALGVLLNDEIYTEHIIAPGNPFCTESGVSANGPLAGTVFDASRSTSIELGYRDPRKYIQVTQDLLNNVLTNITLSAISLRTWWDMVNVTTTHYESTYSLANPLNLILPYSLCLAAATLCAAVAIWSLSCNGVPANDGGFLQIMMATRGNTDMERLVLRERLTTTEKMSPELRNLRVRYGELVFKDEMGVETRRMGFGTLEETLSLRRKME
ncbi:hypothetical protein ACEQ8H_006430 [Pleosporales sp. CAS-2024a]